MLQLFNVSLDVPLLPWQPDRSNLPNQSNSPEEMSPSHDRWLRPQFYHFWELSANELKPQTSPGFSLMQKLLYWKNLRIPKKGSCPLGDLHHMFEFWSWVLNYHSRYSPEAMSGSNSRSSLFLNMLEAKLLLGVDVWKEKEEPAYVCVCVCALVCMTLVPSNTFSSVYALFREKCKIKFRN